KVTARHLPLSRLPLLELTGTASVDAVLEGSVGGPRGKAKITLQDVARPGIDPAGGTIDIAATDSTTTAQARFGRGSTRLFLASASFAAPPEPLAASPRTVAATAELDAPALPLPLVLAALGSARPASGELAAQVKASGTIAAPAFTLSARATGLA